MFFIITDCVCDARHRERMEVYVLLQLRDCPSLKAKGGGARALGSWCCLFWSHTQMREGKKVDGWDGTSTADMGTGKEEKEAAAGPSCPLVRTEVLMAPGQAPRKGAHCWAAAYRLPGSQTRTSVVIHDFNQQSSISRPHALKRHHWKGIENRQRNATSHGISGCIRTNKSHPLSCKNPQILFA